MARRCRARDDGAQTNDEADEGPACHEPLLGKGTAERIGVGQRQVSKIETGDLDSAKVGTIRSYLEAVGGDLALEYAAGDQRIQVA